MRVVRRIVPFALVAAGAALVAAGIARGELPVLLVQATTVCFSCIGIG